jgi:hypothetical protein
MLIHPATADTHGPFRKVVQTVDGIGPISGEMARYRDEILACGHRGERHLRACKTDFFWDRLLTHPAKKRRCEQCRGEAAA